MHSSADENQVLILETDQRTDTFTHTKIGSTLTARLLSVRCQEAQTQTLFNQDYALLVSAHDGSSLSFCVCDGVGSSYKGNFAARYLARKVIRWLHSLADIPQDLDRLSATLHRHLDVWAGEAQMQLKRMAMPEAPALVQEVLEDLRDTHGSETVFLCGRVDAGQWSTPLSVSHPVQALFCWMGNVTARLFVGTDHFITLGSHNDDGSRWSTVQGRCGPMTMWDVALTTIDHITIHTDGLDSIGSELVTMTNEEWHTQTQQLLLLPTNDDMTALELCWLHENEEHTL